MKLKDYIEQGYTVLTIGSKARKIKDRYPRAKIVDVSSPIDGLVSERLLIDRYISANEYVKNLERLAKVVTITKFSNSFCGDLRQHDTVYSDGRAVYQTGASNLLEVKLKDLNSEPEVYYRGKKVFDRRLVSIDYQWETTGTSNGNQYINITGYDIDGHRINKYPSKDSIIHEREFLE
ncbi:hypothetical protein [Enterococcus casseliflavus]|uniref:hypothetical protein n=1 Tax=Enterococcus casseliflavus TaxID=37734 RepID=UPI003D6A4AB8